MLKVEAISEAHLYGYRITGEHACEVIRCYAGEWAVFQLNPDGSIRHTGKNGPMMHHQTAMAYGRRFARTGIVED